MKQVDTKSVEQNFIEQNKDEETFFLPSGKGKLAMVGPSFTEGQAGAIETDTFVADVREWC